MTDNEKRFIKSIFSGDSSGHDYYHTIRVYKLATKIAKQENADVKIVQLADLLHDVDDIKLSPDTYVRVNDTGEETFGLLCFAEITEFAKELHSEMEKVVLMDELPENWTYPLIQPKLIEKYLQVKIIL